MDTDIKARWVSALRSGDYKQGKGLLRKDDKFCCLGVLCELAVAAGVIGFEVNADPDDDDQYDGATHIYGEGENVHYLPDEVVTWAGIEYFNPVVPVGTFRKQLAQINDEGRPFSEIADLIEEHL